VPPDLTLELRLGDAREGARALLAQGARFDAIFLDAFSPGVEPDLWSADFLGDLGRLLTSTGRLSTYTVAMGVRASLARAGLRVGEGGRVGAKAGGTLASPSGDVPPLLPRVAAKLARRLERDGGPC
jgi:tRNA U34 5-methylaminomethyl-2-thiouridine-forming methyltransferase MnmC